MSASRSVEDKIGIKKGMKVIFINADETVLKQLNSPGINKPTKLAGDFDYIHIFSKSQNDLNKQFPKIKKHLRKSGMAWVSWPKAGQLNTDLDIKSVIRIGYDHGLVESKTISVNNLWSAIMFTYPKDGRIYKNSYGTLPTVKHSRNR